jgi:ribosome maturation factor RimP
LNTIDKIAKLANNIAESKELEVLEVKYLERKKKGLVRVFIAKAGGVSIKDCSEMSKELGVLLDAEGFIQCSYILEVSSPGFDRPLKSQRDFERNIGNAIKIAYKTDSKHFNLTGKLKDVLDTEIIVEGAGGNHSISLESISYAKLQPMFK